jgi:hypothetical protein
VVAHDWPNIRAKRDQGESPACQVLLIPDVLIGGNHHVERRVLRNFQKLAVFKLAQASSFRQP